MVRLRSVLVSLFLWLIVFYSGLALIYHIRWLVSYLNDGTHYIVPVSQSPTVWFIVQMCSNIIFLTVAFLLIRFFKNFKQTGFIDRTSLKTLNAIIIASISLAILGSVQVFSNNLYELHLADWSSLEGVFNLSFRSFTRLLVFKEPQSMYILIAIFLWVIKQFMIKALYIKYENETFI